MNERLTFTGRLLKVITPTRVQILVCILLSLGLVAILESPAILERFGISSSTLKSSQDQLQQHFSGLSDSPLASNIALVAFWSVVGLVAYLICWAGYNFIVEARNQVTLGTQYENRGRSQGPYVALLVKVLSCAGLLAVIVSFHTVLSFALGWVAPVIEQPLVGTVIGAIAGIAVLSIELYLVIMFIMLAVSRWYRDEAFTDQP